MKGRWGRQGAPSEGTKGPTRTGNGRGRGGRSVRGWRRVSDGGGDLTRVSQLGYSACRRRCIVRATCSSTTVAMIILFTGGIWFGNRGRPHVAGAHMWGCWRRLPLLPSVPLSRLKGDPDPRDFVVAELFDSRAFRERRIGGESRSDAR